MGKSLAEAKAEAKAAGIPDEDLTPEVLAVYNWEPKDVLAHITIQNAQTDEMVRADLALLAQEAKDNALPAHVAKILGRVVPTLLGKLV